MNQWLILLLVAILVFSCQNNEKNKEIIPTGNNKPGDTTGIKSGNGVNLPVGADTINATGIVWKVEEQTKFLEDCNRNIDEKTDSIKMKNFCSCMLTQAQKYYRSYKQMEDSSRDDFDYKISIHCLIEYPGDDGDKD